MLKIRGQDPEKDPLIKEVGFNNYFTGKNWQELNRQFFDGLAPKYDRLNTVVSLGRHLAIKNHAVKYLRLRENATVLDLCTGSGDIALAFRKHHPTCKVIGVDVSEKMLALGIERTKNDPQISLQRADVLDLPFPDNHFDCVFIGFGLRNLSNINRGLEEMVRLTKPGGLVVNLDMGKPKKWLDKVLYKGYFEKLIPFLGRHVFHRGEFNSFAYLPASNRYFPSPQELQKKMESLGLVDIHHTDYLFGGIARQVGRKPNRI